MHTPATLLSALFVGIAYGAPAGQDGPPDPSSFEYPGQPAERSFKPSYDFCVVGGGTAGLVLGNRLSESGKHTVVVFEAGGPPTEMRTYSPPGGNQFGLNGAWSPIDYNFYSVPQKHLNNRSVEYHPKRGTKFVGNPNHTNDNTYMTWDPDAYGTEGPLKIAFQGKVPASNPWFMNAMSAIGVHPVKEQNNGSPVGIRQGTMTLHENFLRSSSYDSYYKASQGRPNLNVLDRAPVSHIIFDEESCSGNQSIHAVGVVFLDTPSGAFHNVSCKSEVILAAGAFHSPYILKISGIGPKEELEQYGITPTLVNENIGNNMIDHTAFSVIQEVKPEFATIASIEDMSYDTNVLN
ncbi:hypothetical protein PRZ48_006760 [Zasmidium cellare]|uniref:Glucose-methanol-choline oxidoreductase N-terminal domain-containing protein n=1 Tax=Zasmidium cellare TaxID=395010 RepID=A0ABR0EHW1_ZASCE|nr:hypothetical protein PRZ48_006760 [Zasmidium cellare]